MESQFLQGLGKEIRRKQAVQRVQHGTHLGDDVRCGRYEFLGSLTDPLQTMPISNYTCTPEWFKEEGGENIFMVATAAAGARG